MGKNIAKYCVAYTLATRQHEIREGEARQGIGL
jgi:hypothetical protein